jgi:hypothetical protein
MPGLQVLENCRSHDATPLGDYSHRCSDPIEIPASNRSGNHLVGQVGNSSSRNIDGVLESMRLKL